MQKMEVTGSYVELLSGTLQLTKEQARARQYGLESTSRKGIYKVIHRVGFKRGEVFGYDGPDLGRGFLLDVNFGREKRDELRNKADEPSDSEDSPPIAPPVQTQTMTLAELAETLAMSTDDATVLLKDYGVTVKKDTDIIPADKVQDILFENTVKADGDDDSSSTESV